MHADTHTHTHTADGMCLKFVTQKMQIAGQNLGLINIFKQLVGTVAE